MMNKARSILLGIVAIGSVCCAGAAVPAGAAEVAAKPAMYTYVANWVFPRARWADLAKANGAYEQAMSKALADGTLVGFGNDATLLHSEDGATHDDWWSGKSLADVLNVLDVLSKTDHASAPVLASATKHWDGIYVSRYYDWRPGTYKHAYARYSLYVLKADAPLDATEMLSKSFLVPLFEKLLADGAIFEYEIDTQAFHSEAPGRFYIDLLCATADGLDKVNAALDAAVKADPLAQQAFGQMIDFTKHRDELVQTNAVYK